MDIHGRRTNWTEAVVKLRFILGKPKTGRRQEHDPDNLIAWAKVAMDAMQDGGVLADDRKITYLPPEQFLGEHDRLEIFVVEGTVKFEDPFA